MELPAYEGGTGGKIQRRMSRRRALTPYERPPSAVRGPRRGGTASESGIWWLSKLVNPASRFIAGSATRLFSSFCKLLTVPEETQEQPLQVRVDVPKAVDAAPWELDGQAVFNDLKPTKDSGTQSISDIEQLIKQNTYSRAEVDYLSGLIQSRTIEPESLESNCKMDNVTEAENAIRSTRNLSTLSSALTIHQDVAASPAEIAKAYMNSRPPKIASAINLQSQGLPDYKSLSTSGLTLKVPELAVAPRSVLPFSEVRGLSGAGYQYLKPRGRSAIYRMSRSPYFKADTSSNVKWNAYVAAGNAGFAASLTPGSSSNSDGQKVLKRGSLALYSDQKAFGPIRRVRQKFSIGSASKDSQLVPATSLGGSLPQLDKDGLKGTASTHSPFPVNEIKPGSSTVQISENTGTKMLLSHIPSVLEQSSEEGRGFFEQLDKFASSPEKKFLIKPISRVESPSKLTADMLNKRALKSMENVDKSQFISMDANVSPDFDRGSQQLSGSLLKKSEQVVENGPSKPDILGVKLLTAANGVNKNSSSIIHHADTTISFPASFLAQRKPAFQMTAPEDFLELDDEHDDVDASFQLDLSGGKTELKAPGLKTAVSGMPTASISTDVMHSMFFRDSCKMDNDASYILQNDGSSFKFSVATESIYNSSPAPVSIIPGPSDKLVPQVELAAVPDSCLGSRSASADLFSSASYVTSEPLGTKASVDSLCYDKKVQLETSNLPEREKSDAKFLDQAAGSFISSVPSTLSSTDNGTYGGSVTLSRSNGSLHSSSLSSFVSDGIPAVTATPMSLFFSNNTLAATSSSSPPASAPPLFSSTSPFSFVGDPSVSAPSSVALSSDKSNVLESEGKVVNNMPSGFSGPLAQVSPELMATGSSSSPLMGLSLFSGTRNAFSTAAVSALSSAPAVSSSTSISGFGASSLLSSKPPGISGSCSAQPVSLSFSPDSSSSQGSANIIGATGVTMFRVQPDQSSSGSLFSQSSTSHSISFSSSPTLGLSSTSILFGSSPSSSTLGLSSFSSPGFGNVPFTTGNQSAKSIGLASGLSTSTSGTAIQSSGFTFPSSTGVSSSSSLFSFTTSSSNSSTGLSFLTGSSSSSSDLSFVTSASSSDPAKSTFLPSSKSTMFSSTSLGSTLSIPSSTFGSSPSTGFSFGLAATASGVPSFGFSSSTGSVFSFTASGVTKSVAPSTAVFGVPRSAGTLTSTLQNNDQMNVEDSMTDDTNQAPAPMIPTFGQSSNAPASQSFTFGSSFPSGGAPIFQFGSYQNPTISHNSNPFQAGGNLEFAPGGSFSLGSGGGEKSSRKIVKVRRDRIKRKP